MNREHVAFLLAGLAFGVLFGFGLFKNVQDSPDLGAVAPVAGSVPGPRGPNAPSQVGGSAAGPDSGGGAPMVQEVNRLKRLVQEDPQNLAAIVPLANLYHDAAMWTEAVSFYERALTVKPDDPDLLTDLGICYRGLREFERALEVFDRASGLDPSHWQSLFNKVVVAGFDVGRIDLAFDTMKTMESIAPRPPELTDDLLGRLRAALEQSKAPEG